MVPIENADNTLLNDSLDEPTDTFLVNFFLAATSESHPKSVYELANA